MKILLLLFLNKPPLTVDLITWLLLVAKFNIIFWICFYGGLLCCHVLLDSVSLVHEYSATGPACF